MANTKAWNSGYYGLQEWGTWSAQSLLLGYLEGQPIYNACNLNLTPWWGDGFLINLTVSNTVLSMFICPSDGLSPVPPNSQQYGGNTNNYFNSYGTTTDSFNNPQSTGVFAHLAAYGIQNITDGTSNTVAFSEALVGSPNTQWVPFRDGVAAGPNLFQNKLLDATTNLPALMADLATCNNFFSTHQFPASDEDKGIRWAYGGMGVTSFVTIVPPNSPQYNWGGCRLDNAGGGFSFGQYMNATSNHPGGCNVLFADGSVHFIKSTLAMQTWWALGTKANGEVISADQY
jgi:prepilin-type processing-associated H-X9-DG protein